MSEVKRLSTEQYTENVKKVEQIKALTAQINDIAVTLEGKSILLAYQNSVKNLEKKNEIYTKERSEKIPMTPEQKEQIKLFLAGKAEIRSISSDVEKVTPKGKKH